MSNDRERPVSRGPAAEPGAGSAAPETAPPTSEDTGGLVAALAALTERLDREHERAAHREAIIDRLHEENQRLRRDELQSALEPVRTALYRLHDQVRRAAADWAAAPPAPERAAALLESVAGDVLDALAGTGVERFPVEPGVPYDATRHRPVDVETVTDPARAHTVRAVHTEGFERAGRVVRKAGVRVGKPAPDAPPGNAPETNGGSTAGSSRLRAGERSETMNER
ncbi:nucleotide exchange factor GrpE [Actinomadura hibisca]|uniref:nucleotide exchange factor GrpE n=1 Tax=Actinomadura hibisca TaxID=68565 RepID=UPI000830239F|nr:nucleotide exchange factor GrpE [Actinomadura hibisca]